MPKNDLTGQWETYGQDLGQELMTEEEFQRLGKEGKKGYRKALRSVANGQCIEVALLMSGDQNS